MQRDALTTPSGQEAGQAGLQRIDEMTAPPVVGRRYLVPTVTYPWFGKVDAWPVMGPKHTDAEHIGFDHEHYHVDIRFLSDVQVRRIQKAALLDIEVAAAGSPLSTREAPAHPAQSIKRLTCRRESNGYPLYAARRQPWYGPLSTAYAGRRCARNAAGLLICPHKGFALDTLVPDAEGCVVCPLHGLVIDVAAGVVVGALAQPTDAAAPASRQGAAP